MPAHQKHRHRSCARESLHQIRRSRTRMPLLMKRHTAERPVPGYVQQTHSSIISGFTPSHESTHRASRSLQQQTRRSSASQLAAVSVPSVMTMISRQISLQWMAPRTLFVLAATISSATNARPVCAVVMRVTSPALCNKRCAIFGPLQNTDTRPSISSAASRPTEAVRATSSARNQDQLCCEGSPWPPPTQTGSSRSV